MNKVLRFTIELVLSFIKNRSNFISCNRFYDHYLQNGLSYANSQKYYLFHSSLLIVQEMYDCVERNSPSSNLRNLMKNQGKSMQN